MTPKTYKPTPTLSVFYNVILLVFTLILLITMYGFVSSFIQETQPASQLAHSLTDRLLIFGVFLTLWMIIILSILGGIIFLLTANITVQVSKHGFRVSNLIYKSDWLEWDHVKKVRGFSFSKGNQIIQIGIAGLNWMFKLNGLLFWMFLLLTDFVY